MQQTTYMTMITALVRSEEHTSTIDNISKTILHK